MPDPLDYAQAGADEVRVRHPLPRLVRAALLCLAAAIATTVVSVFVLGGDLVWEGGDQNFLKHFPFRSIWLLCAFGTVLATLALVRCARAAAARRLPPWF